jgi:hypothetical protein
MRYDELEWHKRDGIDHFANYHSQVLVPTGRACPMLNDWPAYRVVKHRDPAAKPDIFLLRCYETCDGAQAHPFSPTERLYYGFTADLLTLACLLVHLEPAESVDALRRAGVEQ